MSEPLAFFKCPPPLVGRPRDAWLALMESCRNKASKDESFPNVPQVSVRWVKANTQKKKAHISTHSFNKMCPRRLTRQVHVYTHTPVSHAQHFPRPICRTIQPNSGVPVCGARNNGLVGWWQRGRGLTERFTCISVVQAR